MATEKCASTILTTCTNGSRYSNCKLQLARRPSREDRKVFDEGFKVLNEVQRKEWKIAVDKAKEKASEMGVEFIYPDQKPFVDAVAPLTKEVLERNDKLAPFYVAIQKYNEEYPARRLI